MKEKIESLVPHGGHSAISRAARDHDHLAFQMLRVTGLGPKKVKALADTGVADLVALKAACDAGQVAKLKGFGAKTQTNIL